MTLPFGSTQIVNGVPVSPAIIGGSGRAYYTLPDAVAGETATEVSFTSQAGTTNGKIIGTGLSAVDNFYTNAFVVLTDATPGNGKAAVWAKVAGYVGATQTLTLDSPIDFEVGKTVAIVFPAVVNMNKDQKNPPNFGAVTVTKSLILNLGGCRVVGSINLSAGAFVWIRDGELQNGVLDVRATPSVAILDGLTMSRRFTTIYAYLRGNPSDVAAVEARRCDFRGVVAARCGIVRWVIQDCSNDGIDDTNGNVPYRLVENVVNIAFKNVSVSIDGPFSGAVFYAQGATVLTSAAPNYLSVNADIHPLASEPEGSITNPRSFSLLLAIGATVATVNTTAGEIAISVRSHNGQGATTPGFAPNVALLRGRNLTGSGTLTLNSATSTSAIDLGGFIGAFGMVVVDGASNMTGALHYDGQFQGLYVTGGMGSNVRAAIINGPITTGTVDVDDESVFVKNASGFTSIHIASAQTASTPAVSVTAIFTLTDVEDVLIFAAGASVSVGTWTHSGDIVGNSVATYNCSVQSTVSGGTWTMSGNVTISMSGQVVVPLVVAQSDAGGGTLTVSGQFLADGGVHFSVRNCRATNPDSSVTRSGSSFFRNMVVYNASAFVLAIGGTGGHPTSAVGDGPINFFSVMFEQADSVDTVVVDAAAANDAATGPSACNFEDCRFDTAGMKLDGTGTGTVTWAAGSNTFFMSHVSMIGSFTIVGDPFSFFEVYESDFYGPIVFSGTRPTSRYAWFKCSFNSTTFDATGQPDIVDDWFVLANDGSSKTRGQLAVFDTTPQVSDPANTDTVDGIVLEAVGANNNPVTVVTAGRIQCLVDNVNTVNIGDNLILDTVNPTKVKSGSTLVGQRVGRALTGSPAGVSDGAVYTEVGLR